MAGDYTLESLAVPRSLDLLHDLLERVGHDCPEVSRDDLSMFETAIIEIAGNVVEHGKPQGEVIYEFRLRVEPVRLIGWLADSGEAWTPLAQPTTGHEAPARPADTHSLAPALPDDWANSGRGLFLARAVLDELTYGRVEGRNVWSMVRLRH